MDIEVEEKYNEEKQKVLKEIKYRESVMRQLEFDTGRKRCFFANFIYRVLGIENPSPPAYRKDPRDMHITYDIDSDIELQKDIYIAFEKSKNKLIEVYNSIEKEN